jgi:hypothetical protein
MFLQQLFMQLMRGSSTSIVIGVLKLDCCCMMQDLAAAREQLATARETSGSTAEVLAAEQAASALLRAQNQAQARLWHILIYSDIFAMPFCQAHGQPVCACGH